MVSVPGTGQITAAQDLKYETNSPINIDITVSDGNIEVTETLVVTLTGIEQRPNMTFSDYLNTKFGNSGIKVLDLQQFGYKSTLRERVP